MDNGAIKLQKYAGMWRNKSQRHKNKAEKLGLTLSWSSLSVYLVKKSTSFLKTKITTKKLVNNVTGVAKAGTLTAVMGASGAGKTTLLSALAQRNNGGLVVEGDVRVNGKAIGSKIRKISAFLYQKDMFTPTLTVYEHLVFYARLKLDRRLSKAEVNDKVFEILRQVGLLNVAHRQIGTSGDHFQQMATDHQKTIICAIHQPSSEILDIFDSIVIMAESRTAFIGNAKETIQFLKTQGYECPMNYNPADFFIKILAVTPDDEQNSHKRIKRICDAYVSSDSAQSMDGFIHDELTNYSAPKLNLADFKPTNWLTRFLLLTFRLEVDIFRNRSYLSFRLIQKLLVGLMMGSLYSGSITKDQPGIQALEGFFFSLAIQNVVSPVFSCVNKFQKQFPLFLREYEDGLVSSLQFYTAMCLAWFPITVLESLLVTAPFYILAGAYISLGIFVDTLYVTSITAVLSLLCGMSFSAIIDSYEICTFVLGELLNLTNITAGFYMSLRTVPIYLKLFETISWQRSLMELLSIFHIQGSTVFSCTNSTGLELPCLSTGEQVLDQYGYSTSNFTRDFVSIYLLMVVFYLLGYVFFWRRMVKLTAV
uniref:ATP-binding cassette transporter n=1 Tax=Diaphorina citri TaxID=121845 RepID=A0A6G5VBM1_DIACI|nr:ATP-binding cassette transporter [Diaphorina citri]